MKISGVSKSNLPVANFELLVTKSKFEFIEQFFLKAFNVLSIVCPSGSWVHSVFFLVYLFSWHINAYNVIIRMKK